jgi:hypothetical protein
MVRFMVKDGEQELPGTDEFPIPFGIEADTGASLPGVTLTDLKRMRAQSAEQPGQLWRGDQATGSRGVIAEVDPANLAEAGWAVLFFHDADSEIKQALRPLLTHREAQAARLFKVFEGASGIRPGETPQQWLERQGVGMSVADPERGVPLYLLIIGSPEQVPFEFQYLLALYWNVGRLHFDAPRDYRTYAESVVAYEQAATPPHKKRAAIFGVRNDGDRATALLHDHVLRPLVSGTGTVKPLSGYRDFQLTALLDADATKARLLALLSGREASGSPAFLFTGSHGVKIKLGDPMQREKQGAVICQDWPGVGKVLDDHLFTAADVPDHAAIHGLIHFLFACFGGGCPARDDFGASNGQPPAVLLPGPIVARLPQRLLLKGALASLAHVDRVWAHSFQNRLGATQVRRISDVMLRILKGERIGQATSAFSMRWAALSADLAEAELQYDAGQLSGAQLANRYVARNDARNYIVLGDPAVRLRVESMVD